MKIIRKIWLVVVMLVVCTANLRMNTYAATKEEPVNLYATSAVLLDGNTGRVLFEKEGNTPMPMASTTKIMTCILALELGDLEEQVTVSSYAQSMPEVHLGMKSGETYRLGDLLYSLMLESHNDTAVAIAEHLAGSVEAFAERMNEKARELGCNNTYYITPNGLDQTESKKLDTGEVITQAHETTAIELARIMKYCVKDSAMHKEFLEITQTKEYAFTSNGRSFHCVNHNAYLTMNHTAISGKTGYTNAAGYCYVGAVEDGDECYIVSLLACGWPNHKTYKWSDMEKLITYGYDTYHMESLDEQSLLEGQLHLVEITGGQTEELNDSVYAQTYVEDMVLEEAYAMDDTEQYHVKVVQEQVLEAPVKAGTIVGSVTYYLDELEIGKGNLVIEEAVEEIDYTWCFMGILKRVLVS